MSVRIIECGIVPSRRRIFGGFSALLRRSARILCQVWALRYTAGGPASYAKFGPSAILPDPKVKSPMTFQDLILKLQQFWAKQGCVIVQPMDMEMGAGTFHWATFLRAIGPEPWNVAYVQPSRRDRKSTRLTSSHE